MNQIGSMAPMLRTDSLNTPTCEASKTNINNREFQRRHTYSTSSSSSSSCGKHELGTQSMNLCQSLSSTSSQDLDSIASSPSSYGNTPPREAISLMKIPCDGRSSKRNHGFTLKWRSEENASPLKVLPKSENGETRSNFSSGINPDSVGGSLVQLTFRQQLYLEKKRSSDMAMEMSAIIRERDQLNLEYEKLKMASLAFEEKKLKQDRIRFEVEDMKNTIKELRDELEFAKSANFNLEIQLQKTQESNLELLKEIQEGSNIPKDCISAEGMDVNKKNQERESVIKMLEGRIQLLEGSEKRKLADPSSNELTQMVEMLKRDIGHLESNFQELIGENSDLTMQLKQVNAKTSVKDEIIAQLESKVKMLSEIPPSPKDLCETSSIAEVDSVNKLQNLVKELQDKLRSTEEFSQSQLASSRITVDDLNSTVGVLRSKNTNLEYKVQQSEEKIRSIEMEVTDLRHKAQDHEEEKSFFASQKRQLDTICERFSDRERDYEKLLKKSEELEVTNKTLTEETKVRVIDLQEKLKTAEESALVESEHYRNCVEMVNALRLEKEKLSLQISTLIGDKKRDEGEISSLNCVRNEAVERLRYIVAQQEKCKLVEKIDDMKEKMHNYEYLKIEAEKKINNFTTVELERDRLEASFREVCLHNSKLSEELKIAKQKSSISSKVRKSQAPLQSKGGRQPIETSEGELVKLHRQVAELRRKLSEQEGEKEELKRRLSYFEGVELVSATKTRVKGMQGKINNSNSVSISGRPPSRGMSKSKVENASINSSCELADLQEKIRLLEDEVKVKTSELKSSKRKFEEKESELSARMERLECASQQVAVEHVTKISKLQKELSRLKNQNAALLQQEMELLSKMESQETLQNYIKKLEEEKKQLENTLAQIDETSMGPGVFEKMTAPEKEMAEAVDANYPGIPQFQRFSFPVRKPDYERNWFDPLDPICSIQSDSGEEEKKPKQEGNKTNYEESSFTHEGELQEIRLRNAQLEEELREMRERYLTLSLNFAEGEAQREKLVMTLKNLQISKREII